MHFLGARRVSTIIEIFALEGLAIKKNKEQFKKKKSKPFWGLKEEGCTVRIC